MYVNRPPLDERTQVMVTELKQQNHEMGNKIQKMEEHLSKLLILVNDLHEEQVEAKTDEDTTGQEKSTAATATSSQAEQGENKT